jgi:glycerophosphoryl diester phosphodiesterase
MRRSAWPLFLTSTLYRVVAFTLLAPLVSGLSWLFLAGSGRIVVANEEIVAFLLEPLGLVALIVMAAVTLTLTALEQACMMTLVFVADRGAVPSVLGALRYALVRVIAILQLAGRIVLRVLLLSAPFLALAGLMYLILLTEYDINYYLTTQPLTFKVALAGGVLLGIGLTIALTLLAVRLVFALPILLFEGNGSRIALRESAVRSRGHRLRIGLGVFVWGLAAFVAVGVTTALFIWLGQFFAPILLGRTALLVFVLGTHFLAFTLTQFLVSIATTASFSLLVMHWYDELDRSEAASKLRRQTDEELQGQRRTRISGRVIIGGAVLSFAAAGITGWLLLSNANLEDRTEIVAHRGASNAAPENTLAAIERAIADGAHWVEIDVQRTSDNQVVVVHDQDLMKIGGEPMVITESRYADLARVDVGSWFDAAFADQRIPTLDAVIGRCRGSIKVNIELKYYDWDEQLARRVIEIVEDSRMQSEIVVMSMKPEAVRQVKSARPNWQVGLLSAAALGSLTRVDADFLAVHSGMVTPRFVRRVHRAGKALHVWTVNDAVGMTQLFGMGVDALITDEPAVAVRLLEQRARMEPVERLLVTASLLVVGEPEHVDPMTDGM